MMKMNTIQLDMDKYESILKELGVLKTENEELKKRLQTSHNSDYAKCKHWLTFNKGGSGEFGVCDCCGNI
jgi:hypothetical protein